MSVATLSAAAASYLAEVEAELSDLPAEDRAALMADLADHLADLDHEAQLERERFARDDTEPTDTDTGTGTDTADVSDDGSRLRQRLGNPARYASELRASAGLPPRREVEQPDHRAEGPDHISAAAALGAAPDAPDAPDASDAPGAPEGTQARPGLRPWAAAQFARSPFGPFGEELRVAWWTVRAVLATLVLAGATGTAELPVPAVFGSRLMGLITLIAALWASFRLGRRSGTLPGWMRWSLVGGGAVIALLGVAWLGASNASSGDIYVEETTAFDGPFPHQEQLYGEDGSVRNLFVYDRDGNLLRDVLIYDQDGRPVITYDDGSHGTHVRTVAADANGAPVANAYPIEERPVRYDTPTPTAGEPLPPPAVVVPRLAEDGRRIVAADQNGGVQITLADASIPTLATATSPAPTSTALPSRDASPTTAPAATAPGSSAPAVSAPTGTAPETTTTNPAAPAPTAAPTGEATTTSTP